jgi:RHS repeat-associated protein
MGGGVGGLLYSARAESGTGLQPVSLKYNLSNGRGDIVAQSDSTGTLTWTASYEAYGKRTKETGTNADKQRANTKDEDPTGLLNEGFRYRDIETGVWLSRDPAGFVDGPNLYAYVMQNPWSKWDPDGLWWRDALSAGLDFIPVVSTIKTAVEFVAGQDLITGEAISRAESAAGLGAYFIPGGKGAMKIAKMGAKMADKVMEVQGKAEAVVSVASDVVNGDVSLDTLQNAVSLRGGKNKGDGGSSNKRGTGGEGYRVHDTGPHSELSPNKNRAPGNSTSGADGRVQSHHPVQQEWAKNNVVGYNADDAPTILLPTHAGASHAKINGMQRKSGNGAGNTLRQEMSRGYRHMVDAGVDQKAAQKAMKKNYKYFVENLKVKLD